MSHLCVSFAAISFSLPIPTLFSIEQYAGQRLKDNHFFLLNNSRANKFNRIMAFGENGCTPMAKLQLVGLELWALSRNAIETSEKQFDRQTKKFTLHYNNIDNVILHPSFISFVYEQSKATKHLA